MATTLILRETKGSPLSFGEMDGNLTSLKDNKLEIIDNLTTANMNKDADYIAFANGAGVNKKVLAKDSVFFNRTLIIKVIADALPTYVGNGIARITCPSDLNGLVLSSVGAHVYTAGVTGATTIKIYNETDGVHMLTTPMTIDSSEVDTSTAATPAVIDINNDDIDTADVLRFDITTISSTAANGLELRLEFEP